MSKKRNVHFDLPDESDVKVDEQDQVEDNDQGDFVADDHLSNSGSSDEEELSVMDDEMGENPGAGRTFASAFSEILNESTKSDPILSKNVGFANEIKKRKIEEAVKMTVKSSRKQLREQWCKLPDPHDNVQEERKLRKVATLGVVKLFNAINNQQKAFESAPKRESAKQERALQKVSKESFLGMLKSSSGNNNNNNSNNSNSNKQKGKKVFGHVGPVAKAPWLNDQFKLDVTQYEKADAGNSGQSDDDDDDDGSALEYVD